MKLEALKIEVLLKNFTNTVAFSEDFVKIILFSKLFRDTETTVIHKQKESEKYFH